MWNLKNNTNDSIYKMETDSQTYKTNLGYQTGLGGGWAEGKLRSYYFNDYGNFSLGR